MEQFPQLEPVIDHEQIQKYKMRQGNTRFLVINCLVFLLGSVFVDQWSDLTTLICFIIVPAIYIIKDHKENFMNVFKLNTFSISWIPILTLITIISIPITTFLLNISVMFVGDQMNFLFEDMLKEPMWYLFLTICIMPAISEEFVLRGLMLHHYKGLKWKDQILMSGILFGLFHMNINQFSYSLFLGMVLALAVMITKSLWASIYIHFLNNLISLVMIKISPENAESVNVLPIEWAVLVILSAVCIVLLLHLFNRLSKKVHQKPFNIVLSQEDTLSEEELGCGKVALKNVVTPSMLILIVLFILLSLLTIYAALNP